MKRKLAEMTAGQLAEYIKDVEKGHRDELRHLRALHRCLVDHEQGKDDGQKVLPGTKDSDTPV